MMIKKREKTGTIDDKKKSTLRTQRFVDKSKKDFELFHLKSSFFDCTPGMPHMMTFLTLTFHKALILLVTVLALGQLSHFVVPLLTTTTQDDASSSAAILPFPNDNNNNNSPCDNGNVVDVVYGAQGSHPGFLNELQASLKSVLLHAPLDMGMHVHFLVDGEAQAAIQSHILTHLQGWQTRQPLTVTTYVVDGFLPRWTRAVDHVYSHFPSTMDWFRHTQGAYFRLFAHEVLPPSVRHFIYLDSDVVVLANLQHLWRQWNPRYYFQWGSEWCSGFMLLNRETLPDFWARIRNYDLLTLTNYTVHQAQKTVRQRGLGDQFLMRSMAVTEPHLVGTLPSQWDVSANDGPWWPRRGDGLQTDRPHGIGMLHFNGGGASKDSAFASHMFLVQTHNETSGTSTSNSSNPFPDTWGLAHYYNDLPWHFARYMAQSQVMADGQGHLISIQHVQQSRSR
jgi:hypothetical protein